MSGKNPEEQPKQKKKGDILLTLVLIVAIAVFCYAAAKYSDAVPVVWNPITFSSSQRLYFPWRHG